MIPSNRHVVLNIDCKVRISSCSCGYMRFSLKGLAFVWVFYTRFLCIQKQPENDPERLFKLMKQSIERHPNHATDLSPRLILGLWHPKFIKPATEILPNLRRAHIGCSPSTAMKYFWNHCDTFSMKFSCLVSSEGVRFRSRCKEDGKAFLVWTVNDRSEMIEATKWGVDAILTDKTLFYLELRKQMQGLFTFPFCLACALSDVLAAVLLSWS